VANVIELEAGANWQPPEGCSLVADTAGSAGPGYMYKNQKFAAPSPTPQPPTPKEQWAEATTTAAKFKVLEDILNLK